MGAPVLHIANIGAWELLPERRSRNATPGLSCTQPQGEEEGVREIPDRLYSQGKANQGGADAQFAILAELERFWRTTAWFSTSKVRRLVVERRRAQVQRELVDFSSEEVG